jgi:cytochrome P450
MEEHKKMLDPEEDRDVLDVFIRKQASEDEDSHFFDGEQILQSGTAVYCPFLPDEAVIQVAYDIFFAATETTSTFVEWCFMSLVAYPDVQERCSQEIQEVTCCMYYRYSSGSA